MEALSVRLAEKRQEAQGIASFLLRSADGERLPAFSAGAHIDVYIPETDLVRQYSLCNHPDDRYCYLICVLHEASSRGGSRAMHESVKEGDILKISSPRNNFPLVAAAHSILVAGGIGITPLLCMAESLSRIGASFDLHYCAQSRPRAAFVDRISSSLFAGRVHCYYDENPEVPKFLATTTLDNPSVNTHVYVCGPIGFMDYVRGTAIDLKWPSENIHQEHFAPYGIDKSQDSPFAVVLARSGGTYTVPAGISVVEALRNHGISIPTSCEVGTCGTCITSVLAGSCDHRDVFLTDAEKAKNNVFTPCCSRAKSELLVLDI